MHFFDASLNFLDKNMASPCPTKCCGLPTSAGQGLPEKVGSPSPSFIVQGTSKYYDTKKIGGPFGVSYLARVKLDTSKIGKTW